MTKKQWIAISRDALIRSGMSALMWDAHPGLPRISTKDKDLAFDRLNYLENQIENRKTK